MIVRLQRAFPNHLAYFCLRGNWHRRSDLPNIPHCSRGTTRLIQLLLFSRPDSFASPWTVAHHAPLSMGFPREEYWSGLPFRSPADLPNRAIEPTSPALSGGFFTNKPPGKPQPDTELITDILPITSSCTVTPRTATLAAIAITHTSLLLLILPLFYCYYESIKK